MDTNSSTTSTSVFFTALLAIVLLAAACGGSSSSDDSSAAGNQVEAAETTNIDEAQEDSSAASTEAGDDGEAEGDTGGDDDGAAKSDESSEDRAQAAIDEALKMMTGDADFTDDEARWAQQERDAQEAIRECMAAEGFEYFPVDYSQYESYGADQEWDPDSREWREEYGFGIATTVYSEPEAAGGDTGGEGDFPVDPNDEYRQTLSEGEQKAYDRLLHGDQPDIDFTGDQPTEEEEQAMQEAWENRENIGCSETAYQEIWQEESGDMEAVWSAMEDSFEDLEARILADPEVAAAAEKWSRCMGEAGYSYNDPNEMYDAVYEKSEELWNSFEDPFEDFTEEQMQDMTEEDFAAIDVRPQFDEELAAEIAEFEISLAVTSFDCGEIDMAEIAEELWTQYLAEELEANKDKIATALEEGN